MTAATSIDVYRDLLATGKLPEMRAKVLAWIIERYASLPMTAREIAYHSPYRDAHKRLRELYRQGLVDNGPVRKCLVTGRKAMTWKLADDPPRELIAPARAKAIQTAVAERRELMDLCDKIEKAINKHCGWTLLLPPMAQEIADIIASVRYKG